MAFNINSSINMKSINKVSSVANNVAFKDKFYDDVEKGTYAEIDYSDAAGIDIQEGIEAAEKAREDRIKREQEEARRKAEEARLKLEQERQAKLDQLEDLYKQRDDNNGLFHPFKEAEIEEKIRKLENELSVPHKPDGWESFCDTCEDAAATAVSFVDTAIDTTATFGLSVVEGVVDVGETIVDGAVQVGGGLIAYGVSAFDEEAGAAMKKGIQDFVAYDASGAFYDAAVDLAGIDEDIAYGWAHTAGNITGQVAGYAAITVFTGGAGTMALSGLAAAGSTAETAYANGASFDEAMVASTINGIVGAAAGKGMDKLGAFAKGATSLKGVMGYAAGGVAIGATEPFVNTVVEYNTYGNNNGQSYLDYMDASGGWTKVGIGAGAGGLSIGAQSFKGYKVNSDYIDKVVDGKTSDYVWDTAKSMNAGKKFRDLDKTTQQQLMDKVDLNSDAYKLKKAEYENIAKDTIHSVVDLDASGKLKNGYDSTKVMKGIQEDIPQEAYLKSKVVDDWRASFEPDAAGKAEVYLFQDSSNSYAVSDGVVGRPPSSATTGVGDGGAFVMTKSQYEKLLADRTIFDANGKCIDTDKLGKELGGVKFSGTPVSVKQTVDVNSIELPRGNNQGAFLGEWRPGGKTSGGVVEGVVPQNFTSGSSKGTTISGTTVQLTTH